MSQKHSTHKFFIKLEKPYLWPFWPKNPKTGFFSGNPPPLLFKLLDDPLTSCKKSEHSYKQKTLDKWTNRGRAFHCTFT